MSLGSLARHLAVSRNLHCLCLMMSVALTGPVACDSTSPSQPDRGLIIYPDTASLRISETIQFFATLDGRSVIPTWSSSVPSLIAVSTTGAAIGVAVGTGIVTATVNGVSAGRTLQVVSDYRGRYSGSAIMTSCVRISGSGPAGSCVVGARVKLMLTLDQQSGASISGTLNIYDEPTIGSVRGTINESDQIANMNGTLRSTGEDTFVDVLEAWDTVLTDAGTRLAGTFAVDSQFQNGFGPQHQKIAFSLSEVIRQ